MSKIYIEARSGLGNQLFQFAFGYTLAREFNKDLIVIPAYFDKGWKYLIKKALGREIRLFRLPLLIQDKFSFSTNPNIFQQLQQDGTIVIKEEETDIQKIRALASGDKDIYLKGYWQDPSLFESYKTQLGGMIRPTFELSGICRETLQRIDHSYVAIHVRRGDFLTNRSFGACTIDYYIQAIRHVRSFLKNPVFVVFTNNKTWVRKHFPKEILYSIYASESEKNTDVEEMYLMSKFKSLIISNSTFSWWAAYLNHIQDNQIICPSSWFLKPALQEKAGTFIFKEWTVISNRLELLNND